MESARPSVVHATLRRRRARVTGCPALAAEIVLSNPLKDRPRANEPFSGIYWNERVNQACGVFFFFFFFSFIPHRCSIACLPLFFLLPPSFIVDDWSLFNRKLIIDRRVDFKLDRRRWKDRAIISVITRDGRSGKFWEREGWVDIGLIRAPGTGWKIEDLVDVGTMGHVAARSKRVARRRESSGKRWKRPGILDGQVCQGDQFCALRVEMCPMAFLPAPFVPRDRHSPRADNKATWLIIRHRELELEGNY